VGLWFLAVSISDWLYHSRNSTLQIISRKVTTENSSEAHARQTNRAFLSVALPGEETVSWPLLHITTFFDFILSGSYPFRIAWELLNNVWKGRDSASSLDTPYSCSSQKRYHWTINCSVDKGEQNWPYFYSMIRELCPPNLARIFRTSSVCFAHSLVPLLDDRLVFYLNSLGFELAHLHS